VRAIFISYRRSDSQGEAGRLFDDLVKHYGESCVFMDVVGIDAGRDFRKVIDQHLASCGVLLAIIGPGWLNAIDEQGLRRLDSAMDFIRLETAAALRRDIPVIPVLVRNAKVPRAKELPADIADLAYRNAVALSHVRWRSDVQSLIKGLRPLVGEHSSMPGGAHSAFAEGKEATRPAQPSPQPINPATVERITRALATHIGPIAAIVVKRAAMRCSSVEELCLVVSAEIEARSAREAFLASVRG